MNSITLPDEDADLIKKAQHAAIMHDPTMAAATLVGAQAEAMKTAAANENGAMMGFMGMGMAQQAGGMNAQNLYQMGAQQIPAVGNTPAPNGWKCECGTMNTGKFCMNCAKPRPVTGSQWICSCGTANTGNFCMECAKPRPVGQEGWTCSCGAVNKGKFCQNCGNKKPAGAPLYCCDKCGRRPEDPQNPPKFCPECGDIFDSDDTIK